VPFQLSVSVSLRAATPFNVESFLILSGTVWPLDSDSRKSEAVL